jgi:DNA-binding transcriptional LysR family regulator
MGLDDALIFTRVVECHSFTQAAQGLGMQKSTVSRRIALLEERLGVRLLNRTTRKLRLTEVGQAYYERCRQIMLDFAEAEQAVMQLQLQPSGLLRISAPIEFGQLLLGRVLGEFMREYPQITAEVELTSRKVDPLEEAVDIAIQVGQPQDSTLNVCCPLAAACVPVRIIWPSTARRRQWPSWQAIGPSCCRRTRRVIGRCRAKASPASGCWPVTTSPLPARRLWPVPGSSACRT